jgi:hypothetical protein
MGRLVQAAAERGWVYGIPMEKSGCGLGDTLKQDSVEDKSFRKPIRYKGDGNKVISSGRLLPLSGHL